MTDQSISMKGACRCGATTFEVSAPPMVTSACHCKGCQKMASSAYSLTAICPAPAFQVTQGTPVKGGMKSDENAHFFCPDCMTWMFTRINAMPEIINVRSTLLETPEWTKPYMETMTSEKLGWVQLPVERSFEGFPGQDDIPSLLEGFATSR
ncbi:GFA family protein [Roseibium sp.]|uniref:GFA family protein n=1 Tax=Roseibium sp. TaxID=1936156 RepID=UPI003A98277B